MVPEEFSELSNLDTVRVPRGLLKAFLEDTEPRFERWNMPNSIEVKNRYVALKRLLRPEPMSVVVDAANIAAMMNNPSPLPWSVTCVSVRRGEVPLIAYASGSTFLPVAVAWQMPDAVKIARAVNAMYHQNRILSTPYLPKDAETP